MSGLIDDKKITSEIDKVISWVELQEYKKFEDGYLRSHNLRESASGWEYSAVDGYFLDQLSEIKDKRNKLLTGRKNSIEKKYSGRILCFYPEISLKDAVASVASEYFFDDDDCPPWDIWLHYDLEDFERFHGKRHACLLSWVPSEFINCVNAAIREDTYDCLVWGVKIESVLGLSK